MMNSADPVSAGLIHTVVEEFAGEQANVGRRVLLVGGGMLVGCIGGLVAAWGR